MNIQINLAQTRSEINDLFPLWLRSNEEKLQSKERDVQDYASRLARARLHSQAKDVRDAIQ